MHQCVSQFPALVDGSRRRNADVAGDAARRRELTHQAEEAGVVEGDRRVDLRVGPFEVHVGDDGGPAVARPRDVQDVAVALLDQTVELEIDEAQRRGRSPVTEQPWLDVLRTERLAQQRIRLKVDLRDGEVVGRSPGGHESVQVDAAGGRGQGAHHRHPSGGGGSHRNGTFPWE